MTKDKARELLEDYILKNVYETKYGNVIKLPIVDENIGKIKYDEDLNVVVEQWSFKGLLKIAYDL